MRIKIAKSVIPYKLSRELRAAGIDILHDARPLPKDGLYIPLVDETRANELLAIIEQVIDAHDGVNDIEALKVDAETRVKNVPGWATWNEAQALKWFNDNIEPLAIPQDVKTLLIAYGRLLLALRDNTWPEIKDKV